ncbi:DUF3330 domain-containing protein [Nitrosomonas marina]|uniref:DUF3330 domain-containing protein n=1 Tax=Nitrosomonas marina TaxID=917 RepID=A0A1H8AJH7_9PROT|nr:DUF3330 domain-containing protein [Nitrosomonas marina]SEM69988.1 protein of unknown function [Nitrosomonas marina]
MNEELKPIDPEMVACEVCLKEIPLSEAKSSEASDYVLHYCSLECYAKWKEQPKDKE